MNWRLGLHAPSRRLHHKKVASHITTNWEKTRIKLSRFIDGFAFYPEAERMGKELWTTRSSERNPTGAQLCRQLAANSNQTGWLSDCSSRVRLYILSIFPGWNATVSAFVLQWVVKWAFRYIHYKISEFLLVTNMVIKFESVLKCREV